MYIRSPQTPKALAAQHEGLYKFLLNKWYFDELYDFLFVKPAMRLGTLPVEARRRLADRRLRADGIASRVPRSPAGSSGCRPDISITMRSRC
jgi:NADH-quinone oxidoreductase subunit L